jgi:hypothetical protein
VPIGFETRAFPASAKDQKSAGDSPFNTTGKKIANLHLGVMGENLVHSGVKSNWATAGVTDDARNSQISVPVQVLAHGHHSGGALVDELGNLAGTVSPKLGARVALKTSRTLPENMNCSIKSSYLMTFLESVPEVSAKLKEPNPKERKFEDVVKNAGPAAVLVLVY